jgi:hypothetical protein
MIMYFFSNFFLFYLFTFYFLFSLLKKQICLGLVDKIQTERAFKHGLGDLNITEIMYEDIKCLTSDSLIDSAIESKN